MFVEMRRNHGQLPKTFEIDGVRVVLPPEGAIAGLASRPKTRKVLFTMFVPGDVEQPPQPSFDEYVKRAAAGMSPAAEIQRAHELLQAGAITQHEFDVIKRRILSD
jgi:hypothetical protein